MGTIINLMAVKWQFLNYQLDILARFILAMFIAIPRTFEGPFAVIFFTQLSSRELTIFPQTPTISDYPGFRRKASRSTRLPASPLTTKIQTFTRTGLSMWLGIRTTHGSRLTSLHRCWGILYILLLAQNILAGGSLAHTNLFLIAISTANRRKLSVSSRWVSSRRKLSVGSRWVYQKSSKLGSQPEAAFVQFPMQFAD
ncbi:hypothetical protein B0H14DRAFT_2615579 [Mycena olivaceomarginata]|nr:hypothetical protein B0H14DRAFT_2615579 [Mycena olivaceomarginata]